MPASEMRFFKELKSGDSREPRDRWGGAAPPVSRGLFAIPRTSGWLAQWQEMLGDPEQKIARPRQIYTGAARREFVPIGCRP